MSSARPLAGAEAEWKRGASGPQWRGAEGLQRAQPPVTAPARLIPRRYFSGKAPDDECACS